MVTVKQVLDVARKYLSKVCNEGGKEHANLLAVYNKQPKLPRGYKVKPTDHWCMTFVSALFVELGATALIGGGALGHSKYDLVLVIGMVC